MGGMEMGAEEKVLKEDGHIVGGSLRPSHRQQKHIFGSVCRRTSSPRARSGCKRKTRPIHPSSEK